MRFVVTVRLLWPSDDTVAHSEGGKSSRTSGWSICAMTGWACLFCMIFVISSIKASGSSTNAWASASGLSSTMAMSISPPSFLMRAVLPSCILLHHARSGRVLERAGPYREVTPLPGILFFDAWRVEPTMNIPSNLPSAQDAPEEDTLPSSPASPRVDQAKAREEEARDIPAGATKNQAEDGPSTRRAAIRAYKYLYAMVRQHGPLIQQAYDAAKEHATRSKGIAAKEPAGYRPRPQELPTVPPELTSELLHCLSTLPDPWPLAKVTINMDSASQWVSKMGRLFFADKSAHTALAVKACLLGGKTATLNAQ